MPTPTFPTSRFAFDEQEIDLERRVISGGVSLGGAEDMIATDGGGRWFGEFMNGPLLDREDTLAFRALTALLDEGVTPIIVPFCDPYHQPGGTSLVPHSDDTPFGDDSLYAGGTAWAELSADAALRATTLELNNSLPEELIGGERLTIVHETKLERAYKIAQIVEQTATTATVIIRPPLREATAAGTEVDFNNPRCLMVQQGRAPTRLELGRYGEASIRFVEAP